jgi:hypothetical protein
MASWPAPGRAAAGGTLATGTTSARPEVAGPGQPRLDSCIAVPVDRAWWSGPPGGAGELGLVSQAEQQAALADRTAHTTTRCSQAPDLVVRARSPAVGR